MPAVKRTREQRKALAARKKLAFRKKQAWKATYGAGSNGVVALNRPPRSVNPSKGGPIGQTFETELCYADYFSIDPGIGAPGSHVFYANSLYQVNFTASGGGHQPYGFDSLALIYNNYQVLSSTIEVVAFPYANTAGTTTQNLSTGNGTFTDPQIMGGFVSIGLRDTSTSLTGPLTANYQILEQPDMVTKFINSNSSPTKVTSKFSIPTFYGKTKDAGDDTLSATVVNTPFDSVYYHVIYGPPDGSTNLIAAQFMMRMKLKCRFFNPKLQSTS
jgi:hypothetical protein